MIKLQDFARECGVTDRAVQKHLKKYADELDGLFERKGPNGTWLTDEACDILRGKMKQQPIVVGDSQTYNELADARKQIADLLEDKADLANQVAVLAAWKADNALAIAEANQTRIMLTAAERDKQLLEGVVADVKAEIAVLSDEKDKAEEKALAAQNAAQEAQERAQNAEAELAAYKALPWYKKLRRG